MQLSWQQFPWYCVSGRNLVIEIIHFSIILFRSEKLQCTMLFSLPTPHAALLLSDDLGDFVSVCPPSPGQ